MLWLFTAQQILRNAVHRHARPNGAARPKPFFAGIDVPEDHIAIGVADGFQGEYGHRSLQKDVPGRGSLPTGRFIGLTGGVSNPQDDAAKVGVRLQVWPTSTNL